MYSMSPRIYLSAVAAIVAFPVLGQDVLTGRAAMGDWATDAPGVRRKIAPTDLPAPGATKSSRNQPKVVKRPAGAMPKVPKGFVVSEFASGLEAPRVVVVAPNGDIFLSESKAGRIRILRDADGDGVPEVNATFFDGMKQPFGIAFFPPKDPQFIYIANTDAVLRFPYSSGQVKGDSRGQEIMKLSGGGQLTGGGHWTRDIVFSPNGKTLYVSVGSKSNNDDDDSEKDRARIFACAPDGRKARVFATGLRNPVGLAIHPATGGLWTAVNERDELGDDLVPDYVTHVKEGGFYGWPWYYIGANIDPKHKAKHPMMAEKTIVPDVLLQSHSASLDLTFYDKARFPREYRENAFVALHGSWNRSDRTGYKVVRIPTEDGEASGEYIDFMTGFVTPEGDVWGRPVGVAVAADGSLLVTDDAGHRIWRVTHGK